MKNYNNLALDLNTNTLFEDLHNPKMSDLCGSLINDNDLQVHWEPGDQLVLDFEPYDFCENAAE